MCRVQFLLLIVNIILPIVKISTSILIVMAVIVHIVEVDINWPTIIKMVTSTLTQHVPSLRAMISFIYITRDYNKKIL